MLLIVATVVCAVVLFFWFRACVRDGRQNRERGISTDPWSGQPVKPRHPTAVSAVPVKMDRS
jgi:hypothetical protein